MIHRLPLRGRGDRDRCEFRGLLRAGGCIGFRAVAEPLRRSFLQLSQGIERILQGRHLSYDLRHPLDLKYVRAAMIRKFEMRHHAWRGKAS